jgi:hypothetical protein
MTDNRTMKYSTLAYIAMFPLIFGKNAAQAYDLVADQKGLTNEHRSKMPGYVSGFHSVIGKESRVNEEFIKECSSASGPPDPT